MQHRIFRLLSTVVPRTTAGPLSSRNSALVGIGPTRFGIPHPTAGRICIVTAHRRIRTLTSTVPPGLTLNILLTNALNLHRNRILNLRRHSVRLSTDPTLLRIHHDTGRIDRGKRGISVLKRAGAPDDGHSVRIPTPLTDGVQRRLTACISGGPATLLFANIHAHNAVKSCS